MQLPALLPNELQRYYSAKDDIDLFTAIKDNLSDLIPFFIAACDDQTWVEEHSLFITKTIEVLTRRYFRQHIPFETASLIAKTIRTHWKQLNEMVVKDLTVAYRGEDYLVNSLLFITDSIYLRQIVFNECVGKDRKFFKLRDPPFDKEFFDAYLVYCQEGDLPDLWHQKADELISFMKMALNSECKPLEMLAAETYRRYLDKSNVFENTLMAYQCRWNALFIVCCKYANEIQSGITFIIDKPTLAIELHDYLDDTLKIFEIFKKDVSQLTCKGKLADKPTLTQLVNSCSSLYALDVSDSTESAYVLEALSSKIEHLNLSLSEWLDASSLTKVLQRVPHLTEMTLSKNTQLDYRAWGQLNKLKELISLNLSGCHQIRDADLSIILQSCIKLQSLSLAECNKLLDQGFYLIGRFLRHLRNLDLSRCLLTDAALIDIGFRCKNLQSITLKLCPYITESGVSELLKKYPYLKIQTI